MKMKKIIFLALIFEFAFVATNAFAAVPKVSFLNSLLFQGDTLVASIAARTPAPVSASWDGRELSVVDYKNSYRIVGAMNATEKTGLHNLSIKFSDGTSWMKKINVIARKFPLVDLGVPEKLGVTAEQLTKKLEVEQSKLDSIVKIRANETFFSRPFALPLARNNKIVAPYGELRKSGSQMIRHLGVDFGSPRGSSVAAINDGVVKEAEDDPLYGNTVIVDHGRGIFSLYMHLDEIKARVGETVKYGQVIGTVGETGYATGPHLHLSLKINGVSVDPVRFVNIFK